MANNSTNVCKTLSEKKVVGKNTLKKKPSSTTETVKPGVTQSQANLRRGKLSSNWSQYLGKHRPSGEKDVPLCSKNVPTSRTTHYDKVASKQALTMSPSASGPISTGRCVAIDCEMVGIGDGTDHMLARVSIVDENGSVVYDTFVKPQQRVIDYRTAVSGVRPYDMEHGRDFREVQSEVYDIIKGKLLVGHALRNDLKVLYLSHPKKLIRDTSKFKKFREEASGRTPSLRFLAAHLLGIQIQHGEHSSIEDARAAMRLYMKYRNSWESELRTRFYK